MKNKIVVAANLYFSDDNEEMIRIISARKATPSERKQFKEFK